MPDPTESELRSFVPVISKVIGQIPCLHVYEEYVAGRFGNAVTESRCRLRSIMLPWILL